MIYTGKHHEPTKLLVTKFNENFYDQVPINSIDELPNHLSDDHATWINVIGMHDTSFINKLGNLLNIHPLTQEDIVNVNQRPKIEEYPEYMFAVFKNIHEDKKKVSFDQISFVLGKQFIVTFLEHDEEIFDTIRERIQNTSWRDKGRSCDYLAYAILDAIVDHYFVVLEVMEEHMEHAENRILKQSTDNINEIYQLKRELALMRRNVWPIRELVASMRKHDSELISQDTGLYLQDLYDHAVQAIDTIEIFREMASSLLDLYMSSNSNKMNEIMKVLTIIATIFIPLTFITGIYGMNFDFMPELQWQAGYFLILGVMGVIALFMVNYFKRKGWF